MITQAARMVGRRDEVAAQGVHLASGQTIPVSQKSYTYLPRVRLGQEAGSTAMIS